MPMTGIIRPTGGYRCPSCGAKLADGSVRICPKCGFVDIRTFAALKNIVHCRKKVLQ